MLSIHVVDGDIQLDSRGKFWLTSGEQKLSNQINYAVSTSLYIQNLFLPNGSVRANSNESAIRDAINRTMAELIETQKQSNLASDERMLSISDLRVTSFSKTDFAFTMRINTAAGKTFDLDLARGN